MSGRFVLRDGLRDYLDQLLDVAQYRDYCPNGLQVEGRAEVRKVVSGVTASQALIDVAVAEGADALLVHHGWFWKSEDGTITGYRKRRMATLLLHDISLFAYHIPLDAHAELGNNAELARRMNWQVDACFGEQKLGFLGSLLGDTSMTVGSLAMGLERILKRKPQLIGEAERPVKRIAWCSGAAHGYFEEAIACGADCYISGEISEQTVHLARETGIPYIAAGHHATERYGVQAVGAHLADKFGIEFRFVELDNPV